MVDDDKIVTTPKRHYRDRVSFVEKIDSSTGINMLHFYINGNHYRSYKVDRRLSHIQNLDVNIASVKAIKNYYEEKYPHPNPRKQIQLENIEQIDDSKALRLEKDVRKRYRFFENNGKQFHSKARLSHKYHDWDYMFIEVVVSIHFDFKRVLEKGRGNLYHVLIPEHEITSEIYRAILRVLAKYGSHVNFRLVRWYYVYGYKNPELNSARINKG
jgi:hypothetical protein